MGRRLIMLSVALATAIPTTQALAETDAEAQPKRQTSNESREFPGVEWGTFRAFPELTFWSTRDDNIYAQRSGEVEDDVYTLSPSLLLQSDWQRHALSIEMGGDFDRYEDYSRENVDDYWLGLDGHYEITERTRLFGGLRHTRDHEDRYVAGTPGPDQQREPTRYDHEEAHLGLASELGGWRLRGGATFDRYDFDDATATSGTRIDNRDRRHDLVSLGMRAGYAINAEYEPFVQYATDQRRYAEPIDGTDFNRDSDGYRAAAGLRFTKPRQRMAGEVFLGTLRQRYDHAAFADVSKPYFGAQLAWRPDSVTDVDLYVDRSVEETTVSVDDRYAAGTLDTQYGFQVERKLTSQLSVIGHAAYIDSDYLSYSRQDKVIDASAGLRYYFAPTLFVGGDLRVIDRSSDDPDGEYRRSQISLSLGYTPGRSRNYRLPAALEQGWAYPMSPLPLTGIFDGLYTGTALGHGTLYSETSGSRGDGGSDVSPHGADGFGELLFAGYGRQFGRWYLGAEAEGEISQSEWSFAKSKDDARSSSLEKEDSFGLSLRGGYVVDNGTLLYLRAGRVETRFDSFYTVNNQPASAGHRDDRQSGTRLGLGADMPAGERLFLRMEYAYTDYDAYSVPYSDDDGSTAERFAPEEGQFRIGLGWRFAPSPSPLPLHPAVRGFYVGAHAGHGSVDSRLTGNHSESGAPQFSQPYAGDFAGMGGIYGFFAGYGHDFGRWYAGLEAEVDTADIDWEHTRNTSGGGGRDFSVEKKSDYGIALRLGYSLQSGTLLYGRAGPVRGRFNTTWEKGNNADANIDRSYKVDGMRYGLGAEIPLSAMSFVRLDYTRTYYDSYRFTTGHGNPDQMEFENRESLFRMGLGFRF